MIKYRYWFPFNKKPKKLPKMCQYFTIDTWQDENNNPLVWGTRVRRWPISTRPRKSRDRRLLEALLGTMTLCDIEANWKLTQSQKQQLIAIKDAMQRKGVRK